MTPSTMAPDVTVVVTHFRDARRLELVLAALELQTIDLSRMEVVVADDGSPEPPDPSPRSYAVSVVSHGDLGNRAGPARNLGARAGRGATLVFLDGDTVPEPDFVRSITGACAGENLTVGRRRHADLATIEPGALLDWLRGVGPAPTILDEPAWLADGWRGSDDLRKSDLRSYRYVISAVMACPRDRFERLGGFAEELVGYGGEDWELARRWWLSGGELRHAPDAIGWHDGPDLGGRPEDRVAVKNRETMRLAQVLTDPSLRGRGLIWPYPRVVVRYAPSAWTTDAAVIASAESWLAAGDVGLWFGTAPPPLLTDPRAHDGLPGRATLDRAELIIDLLAPVVAEAGQLAAWESGAPLASELLTIASPRDRALQRAPSAFAGAAAKVRVAPDDLQLERWFERAGTVAASHGTTETAAGSGFAPG